MKKNGVPSCTPLLFAGVIRGDSSNLLLRLGVAGVVPGTVYGVLELAFAAARALSRADNTRFVVVFLD
jgi:hypothetical protein